MTTHSQERTQWYADLTFALGEAEKLLLEADRSCPEETSRLRQRVQILRSELSLLNRYTLGEQRILPGGWPEAAASLRDGR